MKDRIKDYFAFNKKEQRGLIILLGLLLCSLLFNYLLPRLIPREDFDIEPFRQEVEKFMIASKIKDSIALLNKHVTPNYFNSDKGPYLSSFRSSPFSFDPNKLNQEQWDQMEMDPRISRNIIRYLEKGGKFRDKNGFRKIYGMHDSIFEILSPYMHFETTEYQKKAAYSQINDHQYKKDYDKPHEGKHIPVQISLNAADSATLLTCSGIGPYYAGKIIKYRERLGGFYSPEQLLEIKGIDSTRLQGFKHEVITDSSMVRKIDLNSVTFKELLKHPYFEYYLVKAIFNQRDQISGYDSVAQLKTLSVMYEELFNKISPYLKVDSL